MKLIAELTRLELDGSWSLEELSDITRDYNQVYGFAYSLLPDLTDSRQDEINYVYGKFPWRGGFSTVNFFGQLFHKIPIDLRPQIKKLKYESPGYIEVAAIIAVATTVAVFVDKIVSSMSKIHDLYLKILKARTEHKLSQINLAHETLKLSAAQIEFATKSSDQLAKAFGLTIQQQHLLDKRVNSNPVMKLKILLSVYRRLKPIADRQADGRINVRRDPP